MRDRLRGDLVSAMRGRDRLQVATIRTLLSALENAEAIEGETSAIPKLGLNHDQPRRSLSEEDIAGILVAERTEFAEAAEHYRKLGLTQEARDLDLKVEIVDRYLDRSS